MMTLRTAVADMHAADAFHDVQQRWLFVAPLAKHRPVRPQPAVDDVVDRRRRPRRGLRVDKMAMLHVSTRPGVK